jgi:CBS domain-containing protein
VWSGIVSERDVVRQLHAHGASVLSRPVEKIMTAVVSTCHEVGHG